MLEISLDWLRQRIISQLKSLYSCLPDDEDLKEGWYNERASCDNYAQLFDFLKEYGFDLIPPPEIKSKLRALSKKTFNKGNKQRIKALHLIYQNTLKKAQKHNKLSDQQIIDISKERSEKELKSDLNNLFKSFIVRSFVADKYYKGEVLKFCNEKGQEYSQLKWIQEK